MSEAPFRQMPVWQKSLDYSLAIHRLVGSLPEADRPMAARELESTALRIPVAIARGSILGKAGFMSALTASRQDCAEIYTLLESLSELYPQSNLDELYNGVDGLSDDLLKLQRRLNATRPAAKTV